jgi:hypothetical protein
VTTSRLAASLEIRGDHAYIPSDKDSFGHAGGGSEGEPSRQLASCVIVGERLVSSASQKPIPVTFAPSVGLACAGGSTKAREEVQSEPMGLRLTLLLAFAGCMHGARK